MGLRFGRSIIVLVLVSTALAAGAAAHAKRNARQPMPTDRAASATPEPTPDKPKKNERPSAPDARIERTSASDSNAPVYLYEFTRPDFVVGHIVIEHDTAGKGTIAWRRRGQDQDLIEQITVSPTSLEKLNAAFTALNFLDSTEDYQFERDFSNMGNVAITLKKEGRSRTAKYNWTANKDAKLLMDEYRKIANQFVWMFDFNLARENQPLETPKLVDSLDSLLKRNEISDPHQLLSFLQTVSNDERVPLIGRNHAGKLVKQIEKQKKEN